MGLHALQDHPEPVGVLLGLGEAVQRNQITQTSAAGPFSKSRESQGWAWSGELQSSVLESCGGLCLKNMDAGGEEAWPCGPWLPCPSQALGNICKVT